ncbi:MAG: deiodinase-like protein [Pseudomonadales bacterium]
MASAYGALPDRLYLVGRGGRIAFQGDPGPWGFNPEKLAEAIQALD